MLSSWNTFCPKSSEEASPKYLLTFSTNSIQKSFIPKNEISGFSRSRHKGPVTSLEIIPKAQHSASNTLLNMKFFTDESNLSFFEDLPDDKYISI